MTTFLKKYKHAYVDGSAFQDTNKFGIGWVITNHRDKKPEVGSKRLPVTHATSEVAEIYAASRALNSFNNKPSRIIIFSDCKILCRTIAEHQLGDRIKSARHNGVLRSAWVSLAEAVLKHEEVRVQFTRYDDNEYMRVAHHLAQAGARKAFMKSVHSGRSIEIEKGGAVNRLALAYENDEVLLMALNELHLKAS